MEYIPKVSVLMPVYNGEKYLKDAIESVLSQTFTDFEFIIIDDGSTDNSAAIIKQLNDHRIRLYYQVNEGLAATLNRAVGLAKGKYLARQDADDVSLPRRFEKQVEFLEARPDYGMVGTWAEIWEKTRKTERSHKHPSDNLTLMFDLLFDNYFVHSSVMIRKAIFDKIGLYATEKARQPEDYELWSRVLRHEGFKVGNIPEVLVIYREVPSSICRTGVNTFVDRVINMSAENLAWASGREVADPVITDIAALTHKAMHRLSPKPDFRAMLAVLYAAAGKVSASSGQTKPSLINRGRMRYIRIRINYLRYLFGSLVRKIIGPFSPFNGRS